MLVQRHFPISVQTRLAIITKAIEQDKVIETDSLIAIWIAKVTLFLRCYETTVLWKQLWTDISSFLFKWKLKACIATESPVIDKIVSRGRYEIYIDLVVLNVVTIASHVRVGPWTGCPKWTVSPWCTGQEHREFLVYTAINIRKKKNNLVSDQ